jgi:hypothetical protein
MLTSAAAITETQAPSSGSAAASIVLTATFGKDAVLDLSGDATTDGVLTVHLARLALRGAVEASYALRYPTKRTWLRLYDALRVEMIQIPSLLGGGPVFVPKPHADYAPGVSNGGEPPRLMDSLFVLTQHWADPFGSVVTDTKWLSEAERYFSAMLRDDDASLGINMLTRVGVRAQSERGDPQGTTAYGTAPPGVESTFAMLLDAIKLLRGDIWGAPAKPVSRAPVGGPYPFASPPGSVSASMQEDDAGMCAQIILVLLSSFAGIRVEGGFTPSGTTYRSPGLRASAATSNYAKAWRSVRVRTEREAPVRLSTGASTGFVITDDLVVSNDY